MADSACLTSVTDEQVGLLDQWDVEYTRRLGPLGAFAPEVPLDRLVGGVGDRYGREHACIAEFRNFATWQS